MIFLSNKGNSTRVIYHHVNVSSRQTVFGFVKVIKLHKLNMMKYKLIQQNIITLITGQTFEITTLTQFRCMVIKRQYYIVRIYS